MGVFWTSSGEKILKNHPAEFHPKEASDAVREKQYQTEEECYKRLLPIVRRDVEVYQQSNIKNFRKILFVCLFACVPVGCGESVSIEQYENFGTL